MQNCPCGLPLENSSKEPYTFRYYNNKNEIIYALCVHGNVIIDKINLTTYAKKEEQHE